MAMSFVAELIYWAYKYDKKSLRGWSSTDSDDERRWAYATIRRALFCVGGVSRCTFLWRAYRYNVTELRVPMGVLEMTTLDNETREKILPSIERSGMPIVLREKEKQ